MRWPPVLTAVVVALTLALPAPVALGRQAGVTTVIERRFQAADPPAEAEVLQVVLDFAPGAWTPVHVHGGPAYVTVLAGEMTLRMGGHDQEFAAGEGWIDSPDEPHAAGNDGPAPARVVATFVLPRGATPTTVAGTGAQAIVPPGPTTFVQFRTDAPGLAAPLDLVHRFIEYAPGASTAVHFHPGPNHVTVLEGELMVREGAAERKVDALQSFVEPAGHVHSAHNMGTVRTSNVAAALVPRGAPYSTVAEQPAAPAAAAQPKPGAPAPKPGDPAPKPGMPAMKPGPAASPAPAAKPAPAAAPVQAPRALPRTGEADPMGWAIGGLAAAGVALLGAGLVARRRGI